MHAYKPINIRTTLLDSAQLTGTFSSPKPPGTACGEESWKIRITECSKRPWKMTVLLAWNFLLLWGLTSIPQRLAVSLAITTAWKVSMRKLLFTSRSLFDILCYLNLLNVITLVCWMNLYRGSTQEVEIDDHDCPWVFLCWGEHWVWIDTSLRHQTQRLGWLVGFHVRITMTWAVLTSKNAFLTTRHGFWWGTSSWRWRTLQLLLVWKWSRRGFLDLEPPVFVMGLLLLIWSLAVVFKWADAWVFRP